LTAALVILLTVALVILLKAALVTLLTAALVILMTVALVILLTVISHSVDISACHSEHSEESPHFAFAVVSFF
jgi:hypothetical protein